MTITAKPITEAQAIAATQDQEADFMPFRVINEAGKALISQWVANTAKKSHDLSAWFSDAERSANDCLIDETITVEMGRTMTRSGNPEVLRFENSHFDWMINE